MKQQKGSTLMFSLVILTVILMATLAMYRASETTTSIAGNIAFKQAASSSGDIGVTESIATILGLVNAEVTLANRYYAVQQPVDNFGIPSTVDWAQVASTQVGNNNVQTVIERLCSGALPIIDSSTQCYTASADSANSKKVGSSFASSNAIYYRVTVRITGPKNTLSFIQAILRRS